MSRRARSLDFDERARADPEAVRLCHGMGRYIAVNPMADEAGLLQRLGLDPRGCIKVDLYWENNADVMFVQVMTESYSATRGTGYYVRVAASGYVNVEAVVAEDSVDSLVVLRVLRHVSACTIERRRLGELLVPLVASRA